jgi:hypothetical protein
MMRRARRALVLAALLVSAMGLGSACGSDAEPSGEAFRLGEDHLRPRPSPSESPWRVEVAVAKTDRPAVVVHHAKPTDGGDGDGPTLSATPAAVVPAAATQASEPGGLTPIPSPALNWGSAAIDGGWSFDNPTVIGSPLVFLVTANHGEWLEVMAPTRPQQTGWIDADDVTLITHEWSVEIDVSDNLVRVWEGPDLRIESLSVGGKPSSPTPLGRFYINEVQPQRATSVYGTWIISTNGFSDSLDRFSGEVPIFAMHGTNRPDQVGQDISNGCVRLPNDVVDFIAANVPAGTPVDVVE